MIFRLICITLGLLVANVLYAEHTHVRVYAVALANDSTGQFLGASSKGSGLYQSDDSGKTWQHLGWENIKSYSMDLVRSTNGRVLYLATGLGVLKSMDYGATWKQMTDWRVREVMDVAVNERDPSEIWIATPYGPWQSRDSGGTWTLRAEGMTTKYCSRIVFDTSDYHSILLAAEDGAYLRPTGAKRSGTSKRNVPWSWKRVRGIDRPIRAIAQYGSGFNVEGDGISARVSGDSVTLMKHRDVVRWTVSIDPTLTDPFFLFGGPEGADWHRGNRGVPIPVKNVSSSALVPPQMLIGTLGKGIFRSMTNDYALDGRQIWTLRTALIHE